MGILQENVVFHFVPDEFGVINIKYTVEEYVIETNHFYSEEMFHIRFKVTIHTVFLF
jgi:hypothetical protein